MSEFQFRPIPLERMDRIEPNSAYVLILTRSRLGLLSIIISKFAAKLWPLIEVDCEFYAHLAF